MNQLVGRTCVICNQPITSVLDAEFCGVCGNSIHRPCLKDYRVATEQTNQPRCSRCGGDPSQSPKQPSVTSGNYLAYVIGALAIVVISCVVAYQFWEREESVTDQLLREQEARQQEPAGEQDNIVVIETTMGTIRAKLFAEKAPKTVENFIELVDQEFYDGILFHRVIDQFMLQTGDPKGTGVGGRTDKGLPAKVLDDEFHDELRHDQAGVLSMANSGPNTGDTQFFITTVATPGLDNKHAIFGKVIEGMDVVHKIEKLQTDQQNRPLKDVKMITVRMAGKN